MLRHLLAPTVEVSAHCDLPCGVYDPAQARIEAESIKAIIAKVADNDDADFRTRAILIKEQRSELVKHHLWVLWTDYFKPPHFEKYPQLHTLVNEATKLAGASRHQGSSSTPARPTSCSPRSTRSPRSSGRRRRPERSSGLSRRTPDRRPLAGVRDRADAALPLRARCHDRGAPGNLWAASRRGQTACLNPHPEDGGPDDRAGVALRDGRRVRPPLQRTDRAALVAEFETLAPESRGGGSSRRWCTERRHARAPGRRRRRDRPRGPRPLRRDESRTSTTRWHWPGWCATRTPPTPRTSP